MKVFIGSTVFDLLDIRAEIADFLRSIDIVPVLSDDKLSDFVIQHDRNSIETCLVNVDSANEIIFVLDRRYGPRLGAYGFDDLSATHLEYRHAIEKEKTIHFFVRDRLEADYNIWKKNKKKPEVQLSWVGKEDLGLMEFLEERRKLGHGPNWITPFTNSVDLKTYLRRHFDEAFLPERLANAIYQYEFPLLDVAVIAEVADNLCESINISVTTTNLGKTAALNLDYHFEIYGLGRRNQRGPLKGETNREFLSPGQSISFKSIVPIVQHDSGTAWENSTQDRAIIHHVYIEYNTMLGVGVREKHKLHVLMSGTPMFRFQCHARSELISREFFRTQSPKFEIVE